MSRHTHVCVLVIVPKDVHLEEENIVKSKYNCIDKEKDHQDNCFSFLKLLEALSHSFSTIIFLIGIHKLKC